MWLLLGISERKTHWIRGRTEVTLTACMTLVLVRPWTLPCDLYLRTWPRWCQHELAAKHLGLIQKWLIEHVDARTDTRTRPIAAPGSLKWSVKITLWKCASVPTFARCQCHKDKTILLTLQTLLFIKSNQSTSNYFIDFRQKHTRD